MFQYYFWLGLRGLRRNPALTALMVLTLAIGVAASISTMTILHVMSGNPIPHKSGRLLVPLMDNGPVRGYTPGEKPGDVQMSYRDAANLLNSGQGTRRTALYDIAGAVEPERPGMPLIDAEGIATTHDFFAMFEVPFLHGSAWSAADDKAGAKVAVLSKRKSEALFGKDNPVGRSLRVFGQEFRVAGVLDAWNPAPRYMHIINGTGGSFEGEDDIFIPFATAIGLELQSNGSTTCQEKPGPGFQGRLDSECTWIQFWFEVDSVSDRTAIKSYLDAYTEEQRKLGRYPRQAPNQVFDVMEWLDFLHVVSNDSRIAVWLALGFLLLCMVNTMGLLLAKFSVRAPEVGVRRALGATKGAVFQQFLVETAVIGIMGGALGLLLAHGSLWLIRQQSRDLSVLARMDWAMLGLTVAIAIAASVLAGLLPTWRACQVTPALQLKSQ
ncbi:MAG TPA: ABC transporter permease [Paucimonas sp.]|nr:ABC transporter permease [Paucimonas sp.]